MQYVHKGLKITLIVLGSIVGVFLLLFLSLVIAGTQKITDPFPNIGVEVIDVPFSGENVDLTWRVHNEQVDATGVYVSSSSIADFPQGVTPAQAGYDDLIEGTLADGIYSATIPVHGPVVYVRVWAVEYPIARGAQ